MAEQEKADKGALYLLRKKAIQTAKTAQEYALQRRQQLLYTMVLSEYEHKNKLYAMQHNAKLTIANDLRKLQMRLEQSQAQNAIQLQKMQATRQLRLQEAVKEEQFKGLKAAEQHSFQLQKLQATRQMRVQEAIEDQRFKGLKAAEQHAFQMQRLQATRQLRLQEAVQEQQFKSIKAVEQREFQLQKMHATRQLRVQQAVKEEQFKSLKAIEQHAFQMQRLQATRQLVVANAVQAKRLQNEQTLLKNQIDMQTYVATKSQREAAKRQQVRANAEKRIYDTYGLANSGLLEIRKQALQEQKANKPQSISTQKDPTSPKQTSGQTKASSNQGAVANTGGKEAGESQPPTAVAATIAAVGPQTAAAGVPNGSQAAPYFVKILSDPITPSAPTPEVTNTSVVGAAMLQPQATGPVPQPPVVQQVTAAVQPAPEVGTSETSMQETQLKLMHQQYATKSKYQKKREKWQQKQQKKQQAKLKSQEKQITALLKKKQKNDLLVAKLQQDAVNKDERKARAGKVSQMISDITDPNATLGERLHSLSGALKSGNGGKVLSGLAQGFMQSLESYMIQANSKQSSVDTNLQGSSLKKDLFGSYWGKISQNIKFKVGASPYIKQADMANAVQSLAQSGIVYNLQQRALIQTIKGKIATTFQTTSATLTRLVRIQQQDTTNARLGMQAALTSFLNNMYETSEYMRSVAGSVKSALQESMALMQARFAVGFQGTVQKWLGSMYSVGMDDGSVNSIATALGQLASGDISGLGQGASNLLVMAANRSGQSIGQILTEGLNTQEKTNKLLESVVSYLSELYQGSKDSLVVQQELAKVYGLKASDLLAIKSIADQTSLNNVSKQDFSYESAMTALEKGADAVRTRTPLSEGLQNIVQNFKYSMAQSIASNPILYAMYKFAPALQQITGGGIQIPFINAMGFGFDLHMSVSDLMSIAALSGGLLGGIAAVPSGLVQLVAGAKPLLKGYGLLEETKAVQRGSGAVTRDKGASQSESGYAGNASGEDIKNQTMEEAQQDGKKQVQQASQELEQATSTDLNENLIKIYQLLYDVATGGGHFHVKIDDYGLTGFN